MSLNTRCKPTDERLSQEKRMTSKFHIALVGDSIFDNQAYVIHGYSVCDELTRLVEPGGEVTLLAVDGAFAGDASGQVKDLPQGVTHIALSVGGNDALGCLPLLDTPCETAAQALTLLSDVQARFQSDYQAAIEAVVRTRRQVLVCTIYDAVPGLTPAMKTALSIFNDIITREAVRHRLEVLDLRELLYERADFSSVSPIEPSEQGGRKIAAAIGTSIGA